MITTLSSQAVVAYLGLETDGSQNILGGSWSGNGTIQSNLTPGTSSFDGSTITPGNSGVLVDNFTGSGTLSINSFASGDPGTERFEADTTANVTVSIAGGSADLFLANSAPWDGGADSFNSIQLHDLAGVTSVSFTVQFDRLIAGRVWEPTNLGAAPTIAGLNLLAPGTGLATTNFNLSAAYNGVVSSADGINFVPGAAGYNPTLSPNYDAASAGDTTFTSSDLTGWHILRGYDVDGSGAYDATDADKVYIDSVTFTVTPIGAASFAPDTELAISLDGERHANADNAIPEPSVSLLGLAALAGLGIRRRR